MWYRTVICVLLMAVVGVVLGCGLFGQPESDDDGPPRAVTGGIPHASNAGPTSSTSGATQPPVQSAPPLYFGPSSIEERIVSSVAIVRARLTNTTTEVVTTTADYWGDYHYPTLKFTFSVSEYLYGSGADTITAYFVGSALFDTAQEAEDWAPTQASQRDSQFDGRDAVLFLTDGTKSEVFTALVQSQDVYLLSFGGSHLREDSRYWINDKYDRRWLPAASATAPTSANQQFLLEQPVSGTTPSTITLGALKTKIAAIVAEITAGDGSEAYKKCLLTKHTIDRQERVRMNWPGLSSQYRSFEPRWDGAFASGQPTETELYPYKGRGLIETVDGAEEKTRLWLDGDDGELFSITETNHRPVINSDNETRFDFSVVSTRPIPAGTYQFNHNYGTHIDCGNTAIFELTANVTAPQGTLHELFFDPVTVGSTVAADATNGVLKPASFTDANGGAASIEGISYESGMVKVGVTPDDALAGHAVDFIELDGTVSLSLDVTEATVDAANGTLSWSVSSQPWEDGDLLMVRIRGASP